MKKNKSVLSNVLQIAICVLSAVILIGLFSFMETCPAGEDGSWMTCHWAGQALKAVGCASLAMAALALIFNNSFIRIGLNAGIIANSVVSILLPGTIIPTCMMNTMQCNSVTKPLVMLLSCLIAVLSVICIILFAGQNKKQKD